MNSPFWQLLPFYTKWKPNYLRIIKVKGKQHFSIIQAVLKPPKERDLIQCEAKINLFSYLEFTRAKN